MQLPDDLLSLNDLRSSMREVEHYINWVAGSVIQAKVVANHTSLIQSPTLTPASVELIRNHASPVTPASLQALYTALQSLLEIAQEVTITLAAPPSHVLQQELTSWCRRELSATLFVRFQFNATLCGGMVMQCGSHIYDWSMRRSILDNRSHFAEVLRRV